MRGCASDSAAAMKRVPTRTPPAPAASAAATPRARRDASGRDRPAATPRRAWRRAAAAASGPRRPCGRPTPRPSRSRRRSRPPRRRAPRSAVSTCHPQARAAGVHALHERGVRRREEEVDVGSALDRELERSAIHHRDDEVHAERGASPPRARRAPARATAGGSPRPGYIAVTARPRDRQRQRGRRGDAPHRCELDRQLTTQQLADAVPHGPDDSRPRRGGVLGPIATRNRARESGQSAA